MASRFAHITAREDHLVSGYIRLNAEQIIATALVRVCIDFFVCIEQWDAAHKGSEIVLFGLRNEICESTATMTNYQTVLGCIRVKRGIHCWTLVLQRNAATDGYWRIVLGVAGLRESRHKALDVPLEGSVFTSQKHVAYGAATYGFVANNQNNPRFHLKTSHAALVGEHYGAACTNAGDVIKLYLDLEERRLGFAVNGVYHGDAFRDIAAAEYRLALTLGAPGVWMRVVSLGQVSEMPRKAKVRLSNHDVL